MNFRRQRVDAGWSEGSGSDSEDSCWSMSDERHNEDAYDIIGESGGSLYGGGTAGTNASGGT